MKSYFAYFLLAFWTIGVLCYYLLFTKPADNGGDMVEYFGMTESLINHGSIDLTPSDYENLKNYLAPGYFAYETKYEETKGGFMAYIDGRDGKKYPVHFWFYSALATPFRLLLRLLHINELFVFTITNLCIVTAGLLFIFRKYLHRQPLHQMLVMILLYSSPLVFFIPYPGVDIFYPILLLIALFAFINGARALPYILVAIASWHSQPLSILTALGFTWESGYYLYNAIKTHHKRKIIDILIVYGVLGTVLLLIVLIPYITNYLLFGVTSPWYILKDGWTTMYGFGFHNVSLQRVFEQLFDLNMGLFWYAPALCIGSLLALPKHWYRKARWWVILGALIATAIGYHTNPAWKYGSAGFAPTRHILFLIPFLIVAITKYARFSKGILYVLAIPIGMQIFGLVNNGYLNPDFFNSLFHSPYARFVLDRWPHLYNPTPKIFVDNTTHTDKKFLTTAIYKNSKGKCLKAYVVSNDRDYLIQECGDNSITSRFSDDPLSSVKSNRSRTTYTTKAGFWADPTSCSPNYTGDFICMRTISDFAKYTGITDMSRIVQSTEYIGAWTLTEGDVIKITIPPGYFIEHQSLIGQYVNFK